MDIDWFAMSMSDKVNALLLVVVPFRSIAQSKKRDVEVAFRHWDVFRMISSMTALEP